MHTFYCDSKNVSNGRIIIDNAALIHHMKRVLRLKPQDHVVIFDTEGNEYRAAIDTISNSSITLAVKEQSVRRENKERSWYLAVACALPKRSKFDDIVDKLTQLGVDRIIPLSTERGIVRLNGDQAVRKHIRWQTIALEASQQCKRISLPQVDPLTPFNGLLTASADYTHKLLPTLTHARKHLREIFDRPPYGKVLICIGPEGDFTEGEIAAALNSGFLAVTLGSRVLRVETAAVAAAAIIGSYENG